MESHNMKDESWEMELDASIQLSQKQIHNGAWLFLLCLLCSFAGAKQALPDCCRQKNCACRILELLHGMGNHAAGILTLGKRSGAAGARTFQNRLYHLLHSSNNQAAGILTMGKRWDGTTVPGRYAQEPANGSVCCKDKFSQGLLGTTG